MASTGTTILDVRLDDPACEDELHAWLDRLLALLGRRFRLAESRIFVVTRGELTVVLEFPYPGVWKLVRNDREFQRLLGELPAAELGERTARRWHATGHPRDVTASTLAGWLREREAGERDLVLVDVLAADSFARRHLPGAVNLPRDAMTPETVAERLGRDRGRDVVVYCAGYD